MSNARIMIADGNNNLANRMSRYLVESGFQTKVVSHDMLFEKTIMEWHPHFLFIDLLFPGYYAQQALQFIESQKAKGLRETQVIVMSKHNAEQNVKNCLEAGARDFIVKPFQMIDLLQRLALLSQAKNQRLDRLSSQNENRMKNYFHMIGLLVEAANQNKETETLRFELIKMVALALKAVRVSVIESNIQRNQIIVKHSSDDPVLSHLPLDLKKYPELQYVLRTERPLFIESLEKDQRMSFVKHEVKSIQFDSMMVLPLRQGTELMGCLSIRMPKECRQLSFYDMKISEIAAQLIAITWKIKTPVIWQKAG